MAFEHRTDPMAPRVKQTLPQLGAFALKAIQRQGRRGIVGIEPQRFPLELTSATAVANSWRIASKALVGDRWCTDPTLVQEYDRDDLRMDLLPQLSVANIRDLFRAALLLPQLSLDEAAALVISHLDNRTRSRRSRLKKLRSP